MDRISGLPDNLIEKIISRVSLVDAVRTSVLSKEWRYKWTTVPSLILDSGFFHGVCHHRESRSIEYVNIVNNLLSQHYGCLEEMHLINPNLSYPEKDHIDICIWMVLMKGVNKLTVTNLSDKSLVFSSCFLPSSNLTQLKLRTCVFKPLPPFKCFQNLHSLVLNDVKCDSESLFSLTSSCPKLQKLILENMNFRGGILSIKVPKLEFLYVRGKFKSIRLQGAQCVTEMELHLERQDEYSAWDKACLIDFFGSLVSLESLKLGYHIHHLFMAASLLIKLPRPLNKLKFLKLAGICFKTVDMLRTMLCLISSSPNLCKLEIISYPSDGEDPQDELHLQEEDYEHCNLGCLEKIHIGPITGVKTEMDVIKFLLRHSGALQLFDIWHKKRHHRPALSELSKAFRKFPRASPHVKVRHSYHYTNIF